MDKKINSLRNQIKHYNPDVYTCTLASLKRTLRWLVEQKKKSDTEMDERADAKLRYLRSILDTNGDRLYFDDGNPCLDQWGCQNY
jgi:hypothetical protein